MRRLALQFAWSSRRPIAKLGLGFRSDVATKYLKSDAFVRLGVGDYERGAFIEIDRDTESSSTIVRKLRSYRHYWQTGREQDRRGYFPRVVFAVPSEARKDVLIDLFAREPEESWPLYRVVLAGGLTGALIGEDPE